MSTHRTFFASSWNKPELRALRMTIWERYETDERGQVWVAEGIRPDLDPASGADQLEIIDACLDAIEASREFLLLDTGEYGSYLHFRGTPSESSFLELELFQATLLRKPVKYIYVGSSAKQSNLHALVRSLAPQVSAIRVDSLKEAEKAISTYLDGGAKLPETKHPERLTGSLIQTRHGDWTNASLFQETQFLPVTLGHESHLVAPHLAKRFIKQLFRNMMGTHHGPEIEVVAVALFTTPLLVLALPPKNWTILN